jgi:hypothetical protein
MHRCSDKIRKHVDRIMHLMPLAIIMRSPVTCRNGRSMLPSYGILIVKFCDFHVNISSLPMIVVHTTG